jgi:hypothetical protein
MLERMSLRDIAGSLVVRSVGGSRNVLVSEMSGCRGRVEVDATSTVLLKR